MHSNLLIVFSAITCSLILTYVIRIYALKNNVIDIPNSRSSHTQPTPRGGGVAIVITFLIAIAVATFDEKISYQIGIPFFISSALVAIIGFIDDHGHIDAKWRLLVHLLASFIIVYSLNALPELLMFGVIIDFGLAGYAIAVISFIWMLNLFNFMDGIDGLAGIEGLTSSFFAGLFLLFIDPNSYFVMLHWLLAASILGFLILNFPPAKIFMGDSGSGFLGFVFASLLLVSANIDQKMLWIWLILLGVFIVDATFTLLHRLIKKEKLHEAHRTHAYQYASRKFNSHFKVTIGTLIINVLWLAPISFFVATEIISGSLGLIIAYMPLVCIAIKFDAGTKENVNIERT
jgi:Fuc2NAc and GlcNAc transferase